MQTKHFENQSNKIPIMFLGNNLSIKSIMIYATKSLRDVQSTMFIVEPSFT